MVVRQGLEAVPTVPEKGSWIGRLLQENPMLLLRKAPRDATHSPSGDSEANDKHSMTRKRSKRRDQEETNCASENQSRGERMDDARDAG